jgi:hypothetical protein
MACMLVTLPCVTGILGGQGVNISILGQGPIGPMAGRGSGPRIYVGGIPTAVSETMVRNHFTQWGQVMPCPLCAVLPRV